MIEQTTTGARSTDGAASALDVELCSSCPRTRELEATLRCSENVRVALRDRQIALMLAALEKIAKPMREDEHPNDYAARLRYTAIDAIANLGAGWTATEGHNKEVTGA